MAHIGVCVLVFWCPGVLVSVHSECSSSDWSTYIPILVVISESVEVCCIEEWVIIHNVW